MPMNLKKFPPVRLIDLNEKQTSPRLHKSRQQMSLKMSAAVPDTSDDIPDEIYSPSVQRHSSCESELTEFMAHKASADSYHHARQIKLMGHLTPDSHLHIVSQNTTQVKKKKVWFPETLVDSKPSHRNRIQPTLKCLIRESSKLRKKDALKAFFTQGWHESFDWLNRALKPLKLTARERDLCIKLHK